MSDFLATAWDVRYIIAAALLMWAAACLALAPTVGRHLADDDQHADDTWAAYLAALNLTPDQVRADWQRRQENP
jgi:hypothetical protein